MRTHPDCLDRLQTAGFTWDDATALRRIAMTLHRWHELECGDSNDYASWCITRGYKPLKRSADSLFQHDDDGKPYLERHSHHMTGATYTPVADRERGALKRLAKIMARYPDFWSYVQTDPRGAALYVGRKDEQQRSTDRPLDLDGNYSHGIAICR